MPVLDHVILTRFNLPSSGHEALVRAGEGWLRQRVFLFERYCLPSVRTQSFRNFRWIIYFDPLSPAWLKDRIQCWREFGALAPVFRSSVSREEMFGDIRAVLGDQGSGIITTNLDNDDALAVDALQRLQAEPWIGKRTALFLECGLIRRDQQLFLHRDPHNAFCSVRESWEAPVFCWAAQHNRIGAIMPVHGIKGAPGWLQVIHGTNVSNRVHGRLVSPGAVKGGFPDLLEDVPEPTIARRMLDKGALRPARFLREAARASIKRGLYTMYGDEGLDRAKTAWMRVKHWLWRGKDTAFFLPLISGH